MAPVRRIEQVDAPTARYLNVRVRTGYVCEFEPDADGPMEWVLDRASSTRTTARFGPTANTWLPPR